MVRRRFLVALLFVGTGITVAGRTTSQLAAEMAAGAQAFLASLGAEDRARATFPLASEERFGWHYIPRRRAGIALQDMDSTQRKLAHAFLATALSREGYEVFSWFRSARLKRV